MINESCSNEIETVYNYQDAIDSCRLNSTCNCVTQTTAGFKTYQSLNSTYVDNSYSWHVIPKGLFINSRLWGYYY
eukprot:Awhi_evm1s5337